MSNEDTVGRITFGPPIKPQHQPPAPSGDGPSVTERAIPIETTESPMNLSDLKADLTEARMQIHQLVAVRDELRAELEKTKRELANNVNLLGDVRKLLYDAGAGEITVIQNVKSIITQRDHLVKRVRELKGDLPDDPYCGETREGLCQRLQSLDQAYEELNEKYKERWAERDSAREQCDKYDSTLTELRNILAEYGIPEVVPYPDDPNLGVYEASLRAGGRSLSMPERLRALIAKLTGNSAHEAIQIHEALNREKAIQKLDIAIQAITVARDDVIGQIKASLDRESHFVERRERLLRDLDAKQAIIIELQAKLAARPEEGEVRHWTLNQIGHATHEVWSSWMRYMFSAECGNEDIIAGSEAGPFTILSHKVARWKRQMSTPYKDLSEDEQNSDLFVVLEHMPWIFTKEQREAVQWRLDEVKRGRQEAGADRQDQTKA